MPGSTKGCCKVKKNPNIKTQIESGWVGPGPFWIENRKLKNQEQFFKSLMIIGYQKKKME